MLRIVLSTIVAWGNSIELEHLTGDPVCKFSNINLSSDMKIRECID